MTASQTALSMADIYRFLAQSMRYPDSSWLQPDYFEWLFEFLDQLGTDKEEEVIRRSLADADWLENLQVEYTRLFINAVSGVPAPPYGSVYLSGSLYGPSAERTKSFYQEKGFTLSSAEEVPDSLQHELEFLALLNQDGAAEDEEAFLQQHFRPWFGKFKEKVEEEATHPFYPAVVKLIDFFTREEM